MKTRRQEELVNLYGLVVHVQFPNQALAIGTLRKPCKVRATEMGAFAIGRGPGYHSFEAASINCGQ